MDNENLNNEIGTPEDDDVMLPDGYNDENIFAEPEGDDENIFGKEDTLEGFGDEGKGEEGSQPLQDQGWRSGCGTEGERLLRSLPLQEGSCR